MRPTKDQEAGTDDAVRANHYLRRAVDKCALDGIGREQVAEALVRMAEAVQSEIAEERADYRVGVELPEAFDQVPFGNECACGLVFASDHQYCSRCGTGLAPSVVPKSIAGRLQFERRIGKGGSAVVYEAVDLALGRRVAVKTLPTVCPASDIARLRREARALAGLSHRNLATVYGFKVYRGTPMIIMEFVDGPTLAERIPLPLNAAIDVMLEVTDVVGWLHEAGVIHRDIKPRNIAFNGANELKLIDFGLARLEREVTMSGVDGHVVVGTPAYLSPEAHNHEKANPSFDLWALTVVFYELLTGRRPFEAESQEALTAAIQERHWTPIGARLPGCSLSLGVFFAQAFSLAPPDRPSSARELAQRLADLRTTGK